MTRAAPYNREKALESAMQLFWTKGYHATSLKDLESALSMKPGSIYAAFKSKDGLFRAALARYHEEGLERIDRMVDSGATPLEGLVNYIRAQKPDGIGDIRHPACMLSRTAIELSHDETEAGSEARAYLEAVEARLADLLGRAQSVGEVGAQIDVARLARRFQMNLMGLSVFIQRRPSEAAIDELIEDFVAEVRTHARPVQPLAG